MNKYREVADKLLEFHKEREWMKFHEPKNIAISLMLETAEVLELFEYTPDNQLREGKEKLLKEEIGDVMNWLIMMAEHYDIDLFEAAEEKLEINRKRYPVEEFRGSSKKHSD